MTVDENRSEYLLLPIIAFNFLPYTDDNKLTVSIQSGDWLLLLHGIMLSYDVIKLQ